MQNFESWVGVSSPPRTTSWTATDAILYALGVGAGQDDPASELAYTTENSIGIEPKALPTFANVALFCEPMLPDGLDIRSILHAGQAFSLERPLPLEGTAVVTSTIKGIYDKRSGALIDTECVSTTPDGEVLARLQTLVFVRGAGGFGGLSGPADGWNLPQRPPDHEVTYSPSISQALLYRLSGDRNPLHSDPTFAKAAGFDEPILHGMCTYGYTGRALLHTVADGEPDRFRRMSGRLSAPILPGVPITVQIWNDAAGIRFRTVDDQGVVVLDRGTAELR